MKRITAFFTGNYTVVIARWIFYFHILGLCAHTLLNYIDPLGPIMGEPVQLTLRDQVSVRPQNWKPEKQGEMYQLNVSGKETSVVVLKHTRLFIRFDYSSFREAVTFQNFLLICIDLSRYWIWLFLTWCIWKLALEINTENVFSEKNRRRIYRVALIWPVSVFLGHLYSQLFENKVAESIRFTEFMVQKNGLTDVLSICLKPDMYLAGFGSFAMMLIIAIIERGISLKQDNDLTI